MKNRGGALTDSIVHGNQALIVVHDPSRLARACITAAKLDHALIGVIADFDFDVGLEAKKIILRHEEKGLISSQDAVRAVFCLNEAAGKEL